MDAVEDIKSRLSVEDVVGEYIELKRAGRNLKGLSPFGSEKTASFMVSPEKQIWHDFSSGKGGNMFSFIMEIEGVDFRGSMEILARKASIDLSQYQSGVSAERGKQKKRMYELLELAAKFYQTQFAQNKTALEYILKKRDYTKKTALEFQIGYSPNNGRALIDFLKKKGFSEAEVQQAGLATKRYQTASDMFRGRIMIPLHDANGRVVGFTARILEDDPNAPKYINTPQTMLYDKGGQVYGLHLAKEAIRKTKFVVVVEGNLDVIASHQAGVKNVVATAGTALTPMHLKELGRFTPDIRLAFDQDQAGINAAERSIPLANQAGVSLSMITVPSGKDPDELIKKDPKIWQEVIEKHQYALDWFIELMKKTYDISSAEGKRLFTDKVLPVVRQIQDSVEKDHYVDVVAKEVGVNKAAIEQKLTTQKLVERPVIRKKVNVEKIDNVTADILKTQNQFMALLLVQPSLRETPVPIIPDMFSEKQAMELLDYLRTNPTFNLKEGVDALRNLKDYVKMLVLLYEELYQDLELLELQYEATRLQVRLIERYVKSQKTKIVEAFTDASESDTQALLQKAKEFDNLLRLAKESTRGK